MTFEAPRREGLPGLLLAARYRLAELVGMGGVAEVYRAWDERLDRPVAVKLLQPARMRDADVRRRFEVEAKSAAALVHPNVVAVYDFGSAPDGRPFIVTQYVDGETLADVLRARGTLTPAEAVAVARQLAAALVAAHHADLVHRDVKPGNVLIDRAGTVRLADFGIVKALQLAAETVPGQTFGTAAYLAPEQATGEQVTHRADIYATGVVLFEMLTGRTPFAAPEPAAVLYQHVHVAAPPVASLVPGIDDRLARIVDRCLVKDPDGRFGSAADLLDALGALDLPVADIGLPALHDGVAPGTAPGGSESPTVAAASVVRSGRASDMRARARAGATALRDNAIGTGAVLAAAVAALLVLLLAGALLLSGRPAASVPAGGNAGTGPRSPATVPTTAGASRPPAPPSTPPVSASPGGASPSGALPSAQPSIAPSAAPTGPPSVPPSPGAILVGPPPIEVGDPAWTRSDGAPAAVRYRGRKAAVVYGEGSGQNIVRVLFEADGPARGRVRLLMLGLDGPGRARNRLLIDVNGRRLHAGRSRFPNGNWGRWRYRFPGAWLVAGVNEIRFTNREAASCTDADCGKLIAIDRMVIRFRASR